MHQHCYHQQIKTKNSLLYQTVRCIKLLLFINVIVVLVKDVINNDLNLIIYLKKKKSFS